MKFDSIIFQTLSDAERQDQLVELLGSREAFSEAFPSLDIFISLLKVSQLPELHLVFNRLVVVPAEMQQQMFERLLTQEGEWKRLVRSFYHFSRLMEVVPEQVKEQMMNRLLTQEDEWKRLVRSVYHFASLMEVVPEQVKEQMMNRLLTQEDEWKRLVDSINALARLMKVVPEQVKEQMVNRLLTQEGEWKPLGTDADHFFMIVEVVPEQVKEQMMNRLLTQEGEWERLVEDACGFATLMKVLPLNSQLKHLRHLFQKDDKGQLSLRLYRTLDHLHALIIKRVSSEGNPLRSLQECTNIEEFKRKLDKLIQVPELKRLGRLFGQAKRTADSSNEEGALAIGEDVVEPCHLGSMPLEVLQHIGSFAAPNIANKDVNEIIETHLGKPTVESVEALSSSSSSSSSLEASM